MTAKQKRNREAAVENMYYLYKKYYPILEEKLIKASEEKPNIMTIDTSENGKVKIDAPEEKDKRT